MSRRFYFPSDLSGQEIWLDGPEAHHLLQVGRAKIGDTVELFDGAGGRAVGQIVEACKRKARLKIDPQTRQQSAAVLSRELTVATAIPKGDRFRWMIEKLTELGVDRLVPLSTANAVVKPRETKLEKHQQYVIEACKQSGRNHLLQIAPLTSLDDFLASQSEDTCLLVGATPAERDDSSGPSTQSELQAIQANLQNRAGAVVVLIGPEGGFTADEFALLKQAHAAPVCCGSHILRIETAAVALAAILAIALSAVDQ